MKLAQVIPNFGMGGIQKAGQVLAHGLADKGHEVWLIGCGDGPRSETHHGDKNPQYEIIENHADLLVTLGELSPDVVHIHGPNYDEPLIDRISSNPALGNTLLVSTPVFGRPPKNFRTLDRTHTCCVGVYCLYRLLRWLGINAISEETRRRFGCVPLTPFDPPVHLSSALDPPQIVQQRREELGIPVDHFVVGRIGRSQTNKWRSDTEHWVDQILEKTPDCCWVSIGFPYPEQIERLSRKWGNRFINFDETSNYDFLCKVLGSLDIQVFFSPSGECFASSICEPAGLGVPTISLSTPLGDNGQSEQAVEGITGYLVGDLAGALLHLDRLSRDRTQLLRLKETTREYAFHRWHRDVVTEKLLVLYDYWKNPDNSNPEYVSRIYDELSVFSSTYHKRIVDLQGQDSASRIFAKIQISLVESWTAFRLGRTIKKWVRNK